MTQIWHRIPEWARVMGVLTAAFLSGGAVYGAVATQRDLPARVAALESEQEAASVALRYLSCRALAEDESRDPRSCRYVVAGIDDFLDGLRRR